MKQLALLLGVLVLSSGCRKMEEKIAEKAAEKAIENGSGKQVDIQNNGVVVKDPRTGEEVRVGSAATVPEDWPKDLPVYPGAKVLTAMKTPEGHAMNLQTTDAPALVADFYRKSLTSLKSTAAIDNGATKILTYTDGKRTVSVVINGASGRGAETTITLSDMSKG